MTRRRTSSRKPRRDPSTFTDGSVISGPFFEPEFTKRDAKLIGLSVDAVDRHSAWVADIEETQGAVVKYPMIGDTDLAVAKLYNMLPADESGSADGRTAAINATVRSVFIIGPDKKIKLMLTYPMTTGRNFDEILRVLDST